MIIIYSYLMYSYLMYSYLIYSSIYALYLQIIEIENVSMILLQHRLNPARSGVQIIGIGNVSMILLQHRLNPARSGGLILLQHRLNPARSGGWKALMVAESSPPLICFIRTKILPAIRGIMYQYKIKLRCTKHIENMYKTEHILRCTKHIENARRGRREKSHICTDLIA